MTVAVMTFVGAGQYGEAITLTHGEVPRQRGDVRMTTNVHIGVNVTRCPL
jgi:hypothetical protein